MIIISMDSHTELVANLKPFLPREWHSEFDNGEVLARRYFARVIDSFASVPADRTSVREVGFKALPENDRPLTIEEYLRPLPIKERLAMIDAPMNDWVPLLFRKRSLGPFRFTGSTVANLIGGIATVLEEIDDAYKHGLRAISLPGERFLSYRANSRPTTRHTTIRFGRRWQSEKWRQYSIPLRP